MCLWHRETKKYFMDPHSGVHTNHIEGFWGVIKKMFRTRWQNPGRIQWQNIQEKQDGCVFLFLANQQPDSIAEREVLKLLEIPKPYSFPGARRERVNFTIPPDEYQHREDSSEISVVFRPLLIACIALYLCHPVCAGKPFAETVVAWCK